jgi:hypothetical protein
MLGQQWAHKDARCGRECVLAAIRSLCQPAPPNAHGRRYVAASIAYLNLLKTRASDDRRIVLHLDIANVDQGA